MGLQDTVSWYQRKIGTYDKQEWEKGVEQRILTGFNHVLKKTAKLKTDLIDVDLVRGSSFAKAKPKHGLVTVTKLAVIRWLFLPFYYSWWIQQSCVSTFALLLFLYVLQIVNILIYFYHATLFGKQIERVTSYEVLIPAAMMLVLSLIHSEIVATSSWRTDDRPRIKRSRRSKRRNDANAEVASERYPSVVVEDVAESDKEKCETVAAAREGTSVRRRTVAWRAPLKESLAPPPRSADDDGFESLNSHGSGEDKADPEVEADLPRFPGYRGPSKVHLTDSDSELDHLEGSPQRLLQRRRSSKSIQVVTHEHYDSSCESDAASCGSGPKDLRHRRRDMGSSGCECLGVTTNSEECSVSSDVEDSDTSRRHNMDDHPFAWEFQMSSSSLISPSCASSDRVSCTIWEDMEVKRADLSVLDVSSAIIARVESMPENLDYFYGGVCISFVLALLPSLCRLIDITDVTGETGESSIPSLPVKEVTQETATTLLQRLAEVSESMFGSTGVERMVCLSVALERFCLACLFFFLAAVAERTLKQRFLYAKLFCQLTSFRRARRSQLPHFRLNKVRNIKTWLSIRSYLKKRGPQRSVDVIVSALFIITLLLLSFITVELLKDSGRLHSEYNVEALVWCLGLGVFLLRFMTLGHKTNKKYRNLSVLLTEQINLYLQIEQKPNKKEELMVANSVLKLAADLLKELESPFKISGLSTNPYLYTITKVVILSALSGVLSEMLGFKLKLHNIKISSIK